MPFDRRRVLYKCSEFCQANYYILWSSSRELLDVVVGPERLGRSARRYWTAGQLRTEVALSLGDGMMFALPAVIVCTTVVGVVVIGGNVVGSIGLSSIIDRRRPIDDGEPPVMGRD
jgi:hypothetical protein